jgi:hypothetical protein
MIGFMGSPFVIGYESNWLAEPEPRLDRVMARLLPLGKGWRMVSELHPRNRKGSLGFRDRGITALPAIRKKLRFLIYDLAGHLGAAPSEPNFGDSVAQAGA